jgi:hypothetical protein
MPGFHSINVTQLVLLWCTRPFVSWLIICLVPFLASDEIYLSVATSSLVTEAILQLLGAYYMAVAANFARIQRFYSNLQDARCWRKRLFTFNVSSV